MSFIILPVDVVFTIIDDFRNHSAVEHLYLNEFGIQYTSKRTKTKVEIFRRGSRMGRSRGGGRIGRLMH